LSALGRLAIVVPARDEADTIALVVRELVAEGAKTVIVSDNGSRDGTAVRARAAGAHVVHAPTRGYGWACLAGMRAADRYDAIGFIDGDGSFAAPDLARLAMLVLDGGADLGLGLRDPRTLAPHQRAGNALALALLYRLYGIALPDIAPLRVVNAAFAANLGMVGSRYAWPMEMLARAARRGARISTLPVAYGPRRGGASKVSGSLRGSVLAGADFFRALATCRRL
jgi:glycosyltransferase involved in cell wall biosynthesis